MKYEFFEYDGSGVRETLSANTLEEAIEEAELLCENAGYASDCNIRFAIQLNSETVYTGEYKFRVNGIRFK